MNTLTPQQMNLRALLSRHTMPAAPQLVLQESEGALRCVACGHRCLIREGRAGVCKVRFNAEGVLRVPAGYVAGVQVDPIEKKPFFHAYPGQDALSFGMLGCDLHCGYCQNWVTSQALREENALSLPQFCAPEDLVELAVQQGAPVMVSTYNEPLITADWAMKIFEPARERGLACGFVSNGNATPEVLEFIRPWVTLYKVDLKGFTESAYRSLGCTLSNVLESIVRIKEMGFWLEIVTLVVPGLNDTPEQISGMAKFLAGISADIPWHVTAFHPDYKMGDRRHTLADDLDLAYDAGKEAGLKFVYPGNLPGAVGDRESTFCPHCKEMMISRHGFYVLENRMSGNCCSACGGEIAGVWETQPPRSSMGDGIPRSVVLSR